VINLLSGYRIIESSMLLNGATTGMMLVDLGADVIKIESPFLGDYIRFEETAHMHRQVNKGKRSLALDLRKAEGQEIFRCLLASADVFLTNAVVGRNEKLGIGYAQLKAIKPNIIYCQNTGYGLTGPYASVPTHGQMMDAIAGGMPVELGADGLTQPKSGYARRTGTMQIGGEGTATGSIYAAFHIAAALAHRERTGEGCFIDVAAATAVVASAWTSAVSQLNRPGSDRAWRDENALREVARYQSYQTRDGAYILFCPEEKKFWELFCDLVDRTDLKNQHRGETLRRELQSIFWTRDRAEWMQLATTNGLPIGPVNATADEVQADPQMDARQIFGTADDGFIHVRQPALVNGEASTIGRKAPDLGQDTIELLHELGFDASQIDAFSKAEVIKSSAFRSDHLSDRIYEEPENPRA
jgi:formyl-CoA transferase